MNSKFPLLEDEIEIEARSYNYQTGEIQYIVRANGFAVKSRVEGSIEQMMQPRLIQFRIEAETKVWYFNLAVGCCTRLIVSDRPIPDSILYKFHK